MKRVLITGGAGFIGYHLARELLGRGDSDITLLDNFRRGSRDTDFESILSNSRVHFVQADLATANWATSVGTGFDEVYHLAAVIGVRNVVERPHEVVRINALATMHLLDWFVSGGGGKLCFASTSEAYAWTNQFYALPVPTAEDVPLSLTDLNNSRSTYAGSKMFGELAVTHICRQAGLPYTIVRFHNVYGPRMGYEHVIPEVYERVRARQNPLVVFSVDHRRAFCYVQDAVELVLLAMRSPAGDNQTFNVGNSTEEVSIRELVDHIQEIVGYRAAIEAKPAHNDPITRRCPDMSKAASTFGYRPKWTLARGLKQTLAWYEINRRSEGQ